MMDHDFEFDVAIEICLRNTYMIMEQAITKAFHLGIIIIIRNATGSVTF